MKPSHQENKEKLRKYFLQIRNKISDTKRKKIQEEVKNVLLKATERFNYICSFSSKPTEINLWDFNEELAKQNRLVLLQTQQKDLYPYLVTNLSSQLIKNTQFGFLEPNPKNCDIIDINALDCIIVPGLAFDKKKHRLGYGFGYYDRFLKLLNNCHKFGVGFKEQYCKKLLPIQKHDLFLDDLYLF